MERSEFANVAIVAEKMRCDGARFSLPHMGDDLYFQNKAYVEKLLTDAGMSDDDIKDAVKTAVIAGGKGGNRRLIDVWWCNGKAAAIIGAASEHFARSTSEVHMKCFWVERKPGDHERMIDALWSSKWEMTLAAFRGKPREKNRRKSGHKGARIGNPASDNHKVLYKGRGERTGTEVHLKGRQLARVKEKTTQRVTSERKRNPKANYWEILVEDCSHYCAASLMKSLREAGIDMTQYFKGVSTISWERPLGPDDAEALDAGQEAWYASTSPKRLARQMEINFEGEEDAKD